MAANDRNRSSDDRRADDRPRENRPKDDRNIGNATGPSDSWYGYQARINSVLHTPAGWVGFFDGAASAEEDTEERCGIATSSDLRHWEVATTDAPWVVAPHHAGSVRYVEALTVGDDLQLWYECTRADGAHDLRRLVRTGWARHAH